MITRDWTGNVATTAMGAGVVLAGGAAVVAPDPSLLSKPAGVGAITFGLGVMAKGVAGVSLNAANLYSALRYGSSNPDVYLPGSGAEFIATTNVINASPTTATVVGVVDAAFDMATPYGLAKIPFSTAASTIPYVAGSAALFQPVRQTTTTVAATMAQLPGVVDKAGQYSGLVSAYGTLYDTNEREGWYGFAPPKN